MNYNKELKIQIYHIELIHLCFLYYVLKRNDINNYFVLNKACGE